MRRSIAWLIAGSAACASAGSYLSADRAGSTPAEVAGTVPLGLDSYAAGAVRGRTRAIVRLGERLFFEPRLSADGSTSCASCHVVERAFADTLPVSVGIRGRRGSRNTPSILNAAYLRSFGWGGAAGSLQEQVLRPFGDPVEFGGSVEEAIDRLRGMPAYAAAFDRAFGGRIDPPALAEALAAYVTTLRAGDSPFDRYQAGDTVALTQAARAGLRLFGGRARCALCHTGPLFTDGDFHNTGAALNPSDSGRAAVTGSPADLGAFRTPSLRNVGITAPYMHDGSLRTLEDVVEFYGSGGRPHPNLDPLLRPLGLRSAEKLQLIEFLRSLTSPSL